MSVHGDASGGKSYLHAAGVDVQRDVLDLMGFKPHMPDVQDMDHRCFVK